ncbi:MAG TPA: sugar isomerase domain-containing protein [archaeon]|nr:sugar isomerase domain-containing protein [archaeon]
MDGLAQYLEYVSACLGKVLENERHVIDSAAEAMLQRFRQGKVVHIYGPGVHSNIAAEDAFCRKGGLIPINALLDISLSAANGMRFAHRLEGQSSHADACLAYYGIGQGDVLIIANAYGFNAVCVQAAIRARELGAKVIAITCPAFSRSVPEAAANRHPTGKNLFEVADMVIDNHMDPQETVIPVKGYPEIKVGAVATILHSFIINCLVIRVAEKMARAGEEPPVVSVSDQARTDRIRACFASQLHCY